MSTNVAFTAIFITILIVQCKAQQLVSPCPNSFNYEPQTQRGVWAGTVQITTEFDLSGIWMRIVLDKPVISLQTDFGEAEVREDGYIIKNPRNGLKPGEVRNIRITVQYDPNQPAPKIQAFRLNGKVFCQAPMPVASNLVSPCPLIFTYAPQTQAGVYSGTLKISTEQELNGIWLRVLIDGPSLQLTSDFGEAVTREDGYLLKNPRHHLAPGAVEDVRFSVRYDASKPAPQIKGFRLNAKSICTASDASAGPIVAPKETIADLVSPCPDLFNYEKTSPESNRWYGTVTLTTDTELYGIWLRIILDRESVQLGVSTENWFGSVDTRDNKEYLVKNPNFNLKPGVRVPMRFFIIYDTNKPIPKLLAYRVNAKTLCQAGISAINPQPVQPITRPIIRPVTTATPPTATAPPTQQPQKPGFTWITLPAPDPNDSKDEDFFPSDLRPGTTGILTTDDNSINCGTVVAKPRPLITYGLETFEGQYPWHVALYHAKGTDVTYICGATLINTKYVITVAHCVAKRNSKTPLPPERLAVYLGKYYLTRWNAPGLQEFKVKKISIHSKYNNQNFRNDIAIIRLDKAALITDYARPICMWHGDANIDNLVSKEGIVVGWGYDQSGRVTEQLTQATMPVVSQQTCLWSYPEFFSKFTSENTFCGGFRNGTSVCNGDSGGGLVFPKKTPTGSTVWYLRGLVSISVALQHQFCDSTHYVVFTDAAKYSDWIANVLSEG